MIARALGVALAASIVAFGVQTWRLASEQDARREEKQLAAEQLRLSQRSADRAAQRFEVERSAIAAQRLTIRTEVDRVITANPDVAAAVCLDPDGLRVIARAVAGDDPAEPAAAMPAASAAG
jgi:hypothetical protein